MRGEDQRTGNLFAYVNIEERIRPNHPLRPVKALVDAVLGNLSQDFDRLYGTRGRPSIPPEMLLRAMVLQAVYSIRCERQLMERMEFDLLLRWFVGLGMDDPVWNHSTFSKNRDRLLDGDGDHSGGRNGRQARATGSVNASANGSKSTLAG